LLAEEEEHFTIGKPGGYHITSKNSSGLEANNVSLWPLRKLAVFFVSDDFTKSVGGVTNTGFREKLKIIYLRVVLDDKDIIEPYINIGVLYNFVDRHKKGITKFEHLVRLLEYNETKIFTGGEVIDYEDSYTKFKGKFFRVNLYDVKSSEDIVSLVLAPVLKLYREL
jgi:hypothetical protein